MLDPCTRDGSRHPSDLVVPAVSGAIAGIAGTLAMSALMLPAGRVGLLGAQPPRLVADRAIAATGAGADVEAGDRGILAAIVHLAVGAMGGAGLGIVDAVVTPRAAHVATGALLGTAYGLALWALNYVALAPALRILPPPTRDRPGRPPVMLAAHVVYGLTTGVTTRVLARGAWAPSFDRS